jgi:pimeloyl-ACP methyl ester carboxylesterase
MRKKFMSFTKSGLLPVPGASLYYQVRGSGPLLFIISGSISGGPGDWNGFINYLTDAYTVVTYEHRGTLHSALNAPVENISLETYSDDAHRLLAELSTEPAYVFGTSAGALIGLDLVVRHPEQVHTLIAHEPPAYYLLSDEKSLLESLLDLYRRVGGMAAMSDFIAKLGVNYEDRESGAEIPQKSKEEESAEAEALFKYALGATLGYRLDFEALAAAPARIVLAGGNIGQQIRSGSYLCAVAIKERLHTTFVTFPSHHMGYLAYPRTFAEQLRKVLDEEEVSKAGS